MKQRYLEAGQIVTTHGVRGEVRIRPWADSAEFLKGFTVFHIDGKPFPVRSSFVHKGALIAALEGVNTMDEAEAMRGKVIRIDREEARLEPGAYFLQDIIGLPAVEEESGKNLGIVEDILQLPGGDVLVIRGEREILVPRVPEFIRRVDTENGTVTVHLIEGL
ncbi:MAG: 16S rRNA processing protein RimM [Oscillospiraceae bacterium]|nr:16S rRNA processing protein RimM [Oscillospiraceae bacterium]